MTDHLVYQTRLATSIGTHRQTVAPRSIQPSFPSSLFFPATFLRSLWLNWPCCLLRICSLSSCRNGAAGCRRLPNSTCRGPIHSCDARRFWCPDRPGETLRKSGPNRCYSRGGGVHWWLSPGGTEKGMPEAPEGEAVAPIRWTGTGAMCPAIRPATTGPGRARRGDRHGRQGDTRGDEHNPDRHDPDRPDRVGVGTGGADGPVAQRRAAPSGGCAPRGRGRWRVHGRGDRPGARGPVGRGGGQRAAGAHLPRGGRGGQHRSDPVRADPDHAGRRYRRRYGRASAGDPGRDRSRYAPDPAHPHHRPRRNHHRARRDVR